MDKRVLLVNPSYESIYNRSESPYYRKFYLFKSNKVPYQPVLSLAVLAGSLKQAGNSVKIVDCNLPEFSQGAFKQALQEFKPDFVGITFASGLFEEMKRLAADTKSFDPKIVIFGGGSHASAFPEQSLKDSPLDIVITGEADFTICDVVSGKSLGAIPGVWYRKGNKIEESPLPKPIIQNLDSLPFPAWELVDLSRYETPRYLARKNPAGFMETSRGCPWGCVYCNKSVMGRNWRAKSPERVVDEIEYLLQCGFKEIHVADDMFTTQMDRAKKICDLIMERGLKFPWATLTGIRVDRVDLEMFQKMKKAGCYRVYFGIESGSQDILDRIDKKITLEQVRNAVTLAKKAGLEACGFFMMGLPGETEETMEKTIEFAASLDLDLAKTTICIPLPNTVMYNELKSQGRIKINDWTQFNLYTTLKDVYDHENLEWETVNEYYKKFYRRFYLRPSFIARRVVNSIRKGEIIQDILQFATMQW